LERELVQWVSTKGHRGSMLQTCVAQKPMGGFSDAIQAG